MEALILVIVFILLITGILGCFLPVLPGPPISYAGMLVFVFFTHYEIASSTLWIYAGFTIMVVLADYYLPILGTRMGGGGRAAERGAIAGLIIGLFFMPIGIFLGPLLGAVIGEIISGATTKKALKSGVGSFMGFMAATMMKVILSVAISVRVLYAMLA